MSLYCLKHSQVPPCWIILELEKSSRNDKQIAQRLPHVTFQKYSTSLDNLHARGHSDRVTISPSTPV